MVSVLWVLGEKGNKVALIDVGSGAEVSAACWEVQEEGEGRTTCLAVNPQMHCQGSGHQIARGLQLTVPLTRPEQETKMVSLLQSLAVL